MKNRIFVSRPCPSAEDWQALLAGNLPTSRIEEIEAHLDGCLVCVARLDALTPSLPEELWDAALEPATVTPEWAARCHGWTEVASPSEPADDGRLLFERKGKYKSHGPIAFGGMGEVYRAWEIGLERWVAIKIPSRARRSPNAITRFLEEAPRQAQLEHENIVRVYARDEQDGIPFFAMELVTGETLAKAGRESGLQPKRVAELIRQVATAVHCAHKIGVFHRDLKPTNIMLTADGIPKVVDFGLARTLDGPTAQSLAGGAGTDEYMAPEQWEDDPACPRELADAYGRTDVYGLGAVLYELLTGRPPFLRGAHRNETRRRVRFDEPTPPRALCKTVPRDLESICLRCLRKRPLDRFATAKDVADALDRFVHGYPPSESSLLTRAVYLIRRHRTLTATACSGLLLFGLLMSLFVTTRWIHLRSEALHKFEAGRKSVADGQISEGYDRMRSSIDHLPFGEKFFRDYFVRSVAALGANLSLEVAHFAHASQILAAAASPDGRYILLGDEVGHTALWDLAANTNISLPTRSGRPSILAVAFNQTGALCSSGDYDGNVTVWDVHSRRVIWESHLDYQASFLGFIGNGNRLLTGTAEGEGPQMRIWDVLQNGGKELLVDSEDLRSKRASDVVVSPTGDRFVSISLRRSRCLLWDADTVRVIADLSDQPATPHPPDNPIGMCATFSADGSRLAVAGAKLTIHDSRTGAAVRRVDVCRGAHVHCVALRDDGGATLVIGKGRVAAVRRVTPDLEIWDDVPIDRPINPSDVAAFTSRGLILTGRMTRMLRLFQPPPLVLPHADLGADTIAPRVVVSDDASRVATLTMRLMSTVPRPGQTVDEQPEPLKTRLQVWDARTLRPICGIAELPDGHCAGVIAYSPAADTLAVGCMQHNDKPRSRLGTAPVLIGSVTPDGTMMFDYLGDHITDVAALAFTPNGGRLITGSGTLPGEPPAELICWALGTRSQPLWRMPYPAGITAITVSPDGKQLVVGGMDGFLRLHRIDQPIGPLCAVNVGDTIVSATYAHHTSLVAVTDSTDRVQVFDVSDESFARRALFEQAGAALSPLAFDPTDDTLYVKGDHGVHRWDVRAMKPIDPAISFFDDVSTFCLSSTPEAVIAITKTGKMILRTVSRQVSGCRAVVGLQPSPVDPK